MNCCRGPVQRPSHAAIHPRSARVGRRSSAQIHAAHVRNARRMQHAHGDQQPAVDCSSWQPQQQLLKQQPHADAGAPSVHSQTVQRSASCGAFGLPAATPLHGACPMQSQTVQRSAGCGAFGLPAATPLHATAAVASSDAAAPHAAAAAGVHAAARTALDCVYPHLLPASRRSALAAAAASMVAATTVAVPAWTPPAAGAIPLAPLGPTAPAAGPPKAQGLSVEQVKQVLQADIAERQYFVTGQLSQDIFSDNCRFVDPTNDVTGLGRYMTALGLLFDPQLSRVALRSIAVTGPRTIEADYSAGGYLRATYFPWRPKVAPYDGHVTYTLGDDGLVATQSQTWSITPFEALRQTFTPSSGPAEPPHL